MVTVRIAGITTEVLPGDVAFYKRAGYEVVKDQLVEKPEEVEGAILSGMNLSELKAEAKSRGLSGYSALSKDELLALLEEPKE